MGDQRRAGGAPGPSRARAPRSTPSLARGTPATPPQAPCSAGSGSGAPDSAAGASAGNTIRRRESAARAISRGAQRVGKTSSLQVLKEGEAALGVFLGPRRQVQEHLCPVDADARGAQHRLARLAHAYISTASSSSACVRCPRFSRTRERNGSMRSATCGAAYSTTPSAVFSRVRCAPLRYPRPGWLPRS